MANKKSEIKKNKKQSNQTEETEVKASVDTSLKDIFVADAQNTTFTEEDVNELETVKQENIIEETPVQEIIETEGKEIEIVEEQPEKVETISEEEIKEEDIPVEMVVETEPIVEAKQEEPKRKRMTTKEAYGYHWMGLIYDE